MTRKEAIGKGLKTYSAKRPCPLGHMSDKYVASFACIECQVIHSKRFQEAGKSAESRVALLQDRCKKERDRLVQARVLMEMLGLDLRLIREEAQAAGEPFYFSGKPCSNGHISKRHVAGGCYECNLMHKRENMQRTRAAKPEKIKARKKAEYHRNIVSVKSRDKAYAQANPEKIKARAKAYAAKNPETIREIQHTRRARKRNATPPWLTKEMREEMKAMHRKAIDLQQEFGVQFDLDHIVPLDGRVVCGLHVPWNLRVITHEANSCRPKIFSEPDIARYAPLPLGGGAVLAHYQL